MLDDDQLARKIESAAVQMACGAGEILAGHFGRQLSIEYKDKQQRDPVTSADKATQEYLEAEIKRQFPEHGVLGEETSGEPESESRAIANIAHGKIRAALFYHFKTWAPNGIDSAGPR